VLVITIFTFLCIELALRQQLNFHKIHLEPSLCSSNTFYNHFNTSNIIIQKLVWKTQSIQNLPLHIKWIITFLLTSDDVEVLPFMLRSTSAAYETLSSCPLHPTIMNNSGVAIMRGWWLIYWAFVLLLSLPVAILLARYLLLLKQTHKIHNLVSSGRKLFHFIAILLFGPVTWYAPSLMTLSYAVALVLLVLLESLRYELSVSTSRNPDSNRSIADTTMSNKGKTTTITTTTHVVATLKSYSKTIKGRQTSLGMNEFYNAFLDEKDGEEGESLVITHIALLLGCAIPQWIDAGITAYSGSINKDGNLLLVLLPYCGILILGIGDSFGAIVGSSKFGRTRWPGSKRTLEGSASMLLSMLLFVGVFHYFSNMHQEQPKFIILGVLSLSIVTLLEASTMQIDNICLPLAGATVLLIFGKK
jgi:dolichol kinase